MPVYISAVQEFFSPHLVSSVGKKENPQSVGEGWNKTAGRVAKMTVFFLFLPTALMATFENGVR